MLIAELDDFVKRALSEDIGRGDLSASLIEEREAVAHVLAKEGGVLAGVFYAQALADAMNIVVKWEKNDGDTVCVGERIATLQGRASLMLTLERSFLNTLQHASGIASLTRRYVTLLQGKKVALLDTRKTRPGLRNFEKYASRVGGAINHRMGLDDALMVKDTHWAHISSLAEFISRARQKIPFTTMIEVECEGICQAKQAMEAGADIVMCDNMDLQQIVEVVTWRDTHFRAVKIEASGNITLDTIESVASTGVDAISTGSMIHQAVWLDFSMKMEPIHG